MRSAFVWYLRTFNLFLQNSLARLFCKNKLARKWMPYASNSKHNFNKSKILTLYEVNTSTIRIFLKLATSKYVSSCNCFIDSSTHEILTAITVCMSVQVNENHVPQVKWIIDSYAKILPHVLVNAYFKIAVSHNDNQEAKGGQKYIFWATNVSKWSSDQFPTHFTSQIFTRNSAEIIQIVLKTSVIISSFQKMLIQNDSMQWDDLNREKHWLPCRML